MGIVDAAVLERFQDEGLLLNRDESPTTASTGLHKTRIAKGLNSANLGQGAETEVPQIVLDELPQIIIGGQSFDCVYPKRGVGGGEAVRAAAAGNAKRNFGINATADNTLALPTHGRAVLDTMVIRFNALADEGAQGIAIPEFCWPMYKGIIKDARGAHAVSYKNPDDSGKIDPNMFGDITKLQGIIINPEHNPTGKIYPDWYVQGIMDLAHEENKRRAAEGRALLWVAGDMPYYHSRPANADADTDAGEYYYETSVAPIIMNHDEPTPCGVVIPKTKTGGTAKIGATTFIGNEACFDQVKARLMQTYGLSGLEEYFAILKAFYGPEFDAEIIAHEMRLRDKYIENRASLEDAISDIDDISLVDGDPGMTSLLRLDPETMYGKRVYGEVTGHYDIKDTNDIVEFLALNYGIVTVNNGENYLRIANALNPDDYKTASKELATGLFMVAQASPIPDASLVSTFEEQRPDAPQL